MDFPDSRLPNFHSIAQLRREAKAGHVVEIDYLAQFRMKGSGPAVAGAVNKVGNFSEEQLGKVCYRRPMSTPPYFHAPHPVPTSGALYLGIAMFSSFLLRP